VVGEIATGELAARVVDIGIGSLWHLPFIRDNYEHRILSGCQ